MDLDNRLPRNWWKAITWANDDPARWYTYTSLDLNILRLRQNGSHFADESFKCFFVNEMLEFQLKFHWSLFLMVQLTISHYHTPAQWSCWGGYTGFTLSVRPSVRPSRIPCPLCSTCSFGWIHFIFTHLIKQLQKVCRVWSFLQNFKICIFGNFFKFVTLTLSCFHLGSDVNH